MSVAETWFSYALMLVHGIRIVERTIRRDVKINIGEMKRSRLGGKNFKKATGNQGRLEKHGEIIIKGFIKQRRSRRKVLVDEYFHFICSVFFLH